MPPAPGAACAICRGWRFLRSTAATCTFWGITSIAKTRRFPHSYPQWPLPAPNARRIADKLAGYGQPIDFDALKRSAAGSLSRGHLARALLEKGYETDFKACFDKWLNPGCPCYLPQTRALPEEAIDIIHAAGGAAVLAHPVRLRMPDQDKAALIARLARAGLNGLEAVYKDSPGSSVAFFRALAADNGLFVTPGGDFHAPDTQCLYPRPLDPDAARALGV